MTPFRTGRGTPAEIAAGNAFPRPGQVIDRRRLVAAFTMIASADDSVALRAARAADAMRASCGKSWEQLLFEQVGRIGPALPWAHRLDDLDAARMLLRWCGHIDERETSFCERILDLQRPPTPRERGIIEAIAKRVDHHLLCEWIGEDAP